MWICPCSTVQPIISRLINRRCEWTLMHQTVRFCDFVSMVTNPWLLLFVFLILSFTRRETGINIKALKYLTKDFPKLNFAYFYKTQIFADVNFSEIFNFTCLILQRKQDPSCSTICDNPFCFLISWVCREYINSSCFTISQAWQE